MLLGIERRLGLPATGLLPLESACSIGSPMGPLMKAHIEFWFRTSVRWLLIKWFGVLLHDSQAHFLRDIPIDQLNKPNDLDIVEHR